MGLAGRQKEEEREVVELFEMFRVLSGDLREGELPFGFGLGLELGERSESGGKGWSLSI
jgi:hypothetical protein